MSPSSLADAPPRYFEPGGGRRIAYHRTTSREGANAGASGVGVVFLGGFRSDMTGEKARRLEAWCQAQGCAYLRFDYTGHGASSGDFESGSVGDWAQDAQDALEALTTGPQILVGSSMGGWIGLLLAKRAPERVAGFLGVAAAPDFTEDAMWANATEAQRETLMRTGRIELPNDYSDEPYVITRKLVLDGRDNLVLRAPLPIPGPVRLLHGTADADVATAVALRLFDHLESPDARLTLIKGAGHRLSEPAELDLITTTLAELLFLASPA